MLRAADREGRKLRSPAIFALLLALAGCTRSAEELLPIPAAVRGASHVSTVELIVRPSAGAAVAALDERAAARGGAGLAALPFEVMMDRMMREVAAEWRLVSGRAVKLVVEVDELAVAGTAGAFVGQRDRLAGSVFVRDAENGAALGQLYVDVDNANAGLIGVAARGGGVREKLAEEFATRVARQLSGRTAKPR